METDDGTRENQDVVALQSLVKELKQASEEVQKREEMYRFLVENSTDNVWQLDDQLQFAYVAPSVEKITGFRSDEMVGRQLFDFLSPDSIDTALHLYNAIKASLDAGERWESSKYTLQLIHKNGGHVWVEVTVNPIVDSAHRVKGFNGITRDVSERRQQEEELQSKIAELTNERAFSNAVLESVPGLLYLYDAEGHLVRWNKNHEAATGYSAEEMAGMTLSDWYKGEEETIERVTREVAKAFREGVAFSEANLQNKDGSKVPYCFTAVKTMIDNKPYIVGIGIDITERKEAEAALIEKDEELQQSYESLTATHEELVAVEEELRQQYGEVQLVNDRVSRQNAVLSMLHETALGLMSQLDTAEVFAAIVSRLAELTGIEDVFVFAIDKEKRSAVQIIGQGIFAQTDRFTLGLDVGLLGEVARQKKTIIVEDYRTWDRRIVGDFHDLIHAFMQVPLMVANEVIGTLGAVFTDNGRLFTDNDVALIEQFADVAAIALDNARKVQEMKESKDTIEEIFNAANDVIIVIDGDTGEFLAANRQAEVVFGYSMGEIIKLGLIATASPPNVEDALLRIRTTITEGPQLYERETHTRDGRRLVLEVQSSPAFIHGKVRCLAVMRDITERKQMEEDIIQLAAQNRAILNAIPDIIVTHNRQGDFLSYKASKSSAFSSLPAAPVGKNARDFFPLAYLPKVLVAIEQALLNGQYVYEAKLFTPEEDIYVESRYVKVNDDEVLVVVRDITERYRMEERMEFLRVMDLMTGVYNRAFFEMDIVRIQVGEYRGIGMFICDVDGLKIINDTLGHRQGDELLKNVAGLLEGGIQKPNYVARIGGDEFAVILFEPTKARMEELDRYYRREVEIYNQDNPQLPLSLSFGWAVDKNSSIDVVFKTADNNMYRQKMHQKQSVRGSIVQLMMKALEAKDHITEGHVDRLGDMMEKMGHKLGVSQGGIADLRLFAKFHDIGKVGIPENILNKPGPLTEDEMTIMRQHCDIGFRIAKASPDLEPIADWILKHQEHWDGKGYPLGISAEQIPIQCRILGIVDAFDAMVSDRPYRKAMCRADAIAEIRRCAGTQFDPALADMFIEIVT